MKNLITIGLPSKGRLKDKSLSFFNDNGFKILQSNKERNYFASIQNKPNAKIIYLHAKEIIQRLGDGTLDIGISGLDLLKESEKNLQDKINIKKKLNFGEANLVVAVPDDWIDVQTIAVTSSRKRWISSVRTEAAMSSPILVMPELASLGSALSERAR